MDRSRADSIADELEGLIVDGTLADGERLDEVQLAERFEVSRTPIREAFQRLASSGLVQHLPRRGVFVRQPGAVELVQMFEFMAELEAVAVRLAADRITEEALARLIENNGRCNAAVEAGDSDLYYRENETFHAMIYAQSGNAYLEQQCLKLQRRLQAYRRLQLRLRGRLSESMQEHEDVVLALSEGDGERGADVMRRHVSVQGEKFHLLMATLSAA